jgi:hypothetical protein
VVCRLVRKDRAVNLNGKVYEVPPTLIDRQVELHFHTEEPDEIEVFFDGRSYGKAQLVDVALNKRVGREGRTADKPFSEEYLPRPSEVMSGKLFEGNHE